MTELATQEGATPSPNVEARAAILAIESAIHAYNTEHGLSTPDCPLIHAFAPGAYGRQIFIPKETLVVGKIHKHAHLNFLMKGKVSVATEEGPVLLEGPLMLVSKAGTKRVVYTHEDTVWATVHLTDKTDLQEIEDEIIAPSYAALDLREDADVRQLLPWIQKQEEDAL